MAGYVGANGLDVLLDILELLCEEYSQGLNGICAHILFNRSGTFRNTLL